MKILKSVLIVVAIIIAVPLVIGLFVKKEYAVEQQIVISQPKQEVFDYIKYLKNQDTYSVWSKIDPQMRQSYVGVDGTAGFEAFWESDNPDAGKGSQEITKIEDGRIVETVIRFIEPFESTAQAYMITEAGQSGQTIVKWGMSGRMPYPINLMLVVFSIEKDIARDLQDGLQNLKVLLES